MGKRRAGRGSKYSDEFKRRLVAESHEAGVSVPMVSGRHGVPAGRIYSWRGDARFQPDGTEAAVFMPVGISDGGSDALSVRPARKSTPPTEVEITLENGRKLPVSVGVDAGFVLELARGLAA